MVREDIERMCGAMNQRIKSAGSSSQLAAVIGGPNVGAWVYQSGLPQNCRRSSFESCL